MSEIFTSGIQIPQDIDGFSTVPKGYKTYLDSDKEHGTEWMKTVIKANFPAITNLQVFHEEKSDIGGNMIVRFLYNNNPVEFPISYQQKLATITPQKFEDLAPHIQRMNGETRGLFNVILQKIGKKEAINKKTKIALSELEEATLTA